MTLPEAMRIGDTLVRGGTADPSIVRTVAAMYRDQIKRAPDDARHVATWGGLADSFERRIVTP